MLILDSLWKSMSSCHFIINMGCQKLKYLWMLHFRKLEEKFPQLWKEEDYSSKIVIKYLVKVIYFVTNTNIIMSTFGFTFPVVTVRCKHYVSGLKILFHSNFCDFAILFYLKLFFFLTDHFVFFFFIYTHSFIFLVLPFRIYSAIKLQYKYDTAVINSKHFK